VNRLVTVLGTEMESAIEKATLAMNLRVQTNLLTDLDTSIVKIGKGLKLSFCLAE